MLLLLFVLAFSFAVNAACDNTIKDANEEGVDCGGVCATPCMEPVCDNNKICNINQGEDCDNCPGDCETCEVLCSDGKKNLASVEDNVDCGGYCKACSDICSVNGKCEIDLLNYGYSDNEDSQNCPEDCYCGDQVCDDYESITESCETDCGEAPTCGDYICGPNEDVNCPEDCQWGNVVCGDYLCDAGEDVDCPQDCEPDYYGTTYTNDKNRIVKIIAFIVLVLLALVGVYSLIKKWQKSKLIVPSPKVEVVWGKPSKKASLKKKVKPKKKR